MNTFRNQFLDIVNLQLRKGRPLVPDTTNYRIIRSDRLLKGSFIQLWIRTRGCHHDHLGGCTMCDYWTSNPVSIDLLVKSFQEALVSLDTDPHILLVSLSGSFFDEWELPREARLQILNLLSRYKDTFFIFETRADTLSKRKLAECCAILGKNRIQLALGLESSNKWVLKYCVNKALDIDKVKKAIEIAKSYEIEVSVNIMVGQPFLTDAEAVEDSLKAIDWAFSHGADRCVLFPLNVKPWTLAYFLTEANIYKPPSLWSLVEVLTNVQDRLLPYTEISWYKARQTTHPGYNILIQNPTTCPQCYDDVIQLLDEYARSRDRGRIISELKEKKCECRKLWFIEKKAISTPIHQRLHVAYQYIGQQIMGVEWWESYGEEIIRNIPIYSA